MHTWAKRGLKISLFTGGLLMLGTGIASADEDVNPDKPASSPLNGSVIVPIHIDNNAIGTPIGQIDVPGINNQVGVDGSDVAGAMPAGQTTHEDLLADPLLGNRVPIDVVAPVDISGNAIAIASEAEVVNDSQQSYGGDNSVTTDGTGGLIEGNVVDLDYALPIQITGNAIAAAGEASTVDTSSQEAIATGDTETSGTDGIGSGNVVASQTATPIQMTGNAIAGAGEASAESEAQNTGTAGGTILTDGTSSIASGTGIGAPVAVPAKLNGNAVAAVAESEAVSDATADAYAGDVRPGLYGVPTYIETSGENSLAGGTVGQAPVAVEAMICGNSVVGGGFAGAEAVCDSEVISGGANRTSGADSIGGGTIASTPAAVPVEFFGNTGAVAGESEALADKTVETIAGADNYTRGHGSIAGGTVGEAAAATPVDIFGNAIAGAACATTETTQDVTADAGGNSGTTGDDSLGGGNMVQGPAAVPMEGFGNVVSGAGGGGAFATAEETKVVSAGGGGNTDDDNGIAASNLVTGPVATAAQIFGNGVGAASVHNATGTNDTEVTAGGDENATGTGGIGSGNIVHGPLVLPTSLPVQVFGMGGTVVGEGTQTAINEMDSSAGGDQTSDGTGGIGSGNVVDTPGEVGGVAQMFGNAIGIAGTNESIVGSETSSSSGGDVETAGTGGIASGNVAQGHATPIAQIFGDAISGLGGLGVTTTTNKTEASSGGDITTNGDEGLGSGIIANVPAVAAVQPFGDAVAAFGSLSDATGLSQTDGMAGGVTTTSGMLGSLSGLDAQVPAGVNLPIYNVPVEVLAEALTFSANDSSILAGESAGLVDMPVSGGLAATELPTMMQQQSRGLPADPNVGSFTGVLDGVTDVPGEYHILPYPLPEERAAKPMPTPQLPIQGDLLKFDLPIVGDLFDNGGRGLPTDTTLPGVPGLPKLPDVTSIIPAVPAAPAVPAVPSVQSVVPAVPSVAPARTGEAPVGALDGVNVENPSLTQTRAALASLFTHFPIG